MEDIANAVLQMKRVSDDIYWILHLLTCIKEVHSFFIGSGIVKQCLELIYELPINSQHVKTVTPLLRVIGNLVTEETGHVGLELLHEWTTVNVIGDKVWASGYQHLLDEFCWMVGNIVNHSAPAIQNVLKDKMSELIPRQQIS